MSQPNEYNVALYCRLSKDDGTNDESSSISSQKSILKNYVLNKGWNIVDYYIDDGYSGTNFERPSFKRMIHDIENGKINCVITKDLSRLGRNYLDCGLYLEVFFPEHRVRYIAINDNVDTKNGSSMDITPFRNILNEMYAADISKKVKSAKKVRFEQGLLMASVAPYGYKKDPNDNHHLVVDEKTANIVKRIFAMATEGMTTSAIARVLKSENIPRPSAYKAESGEVQFLKYDKYGKTNWTHNTISTIIQNPVYLGHLVGYRRLRINMKTHKQISMPKEDWKIVENTHEPLVSQEDFDLAQKLLESRRYTGKSGYDNIFARMVYCDTCGAVMRKVNANRRKRDDPIDCVQYQCRNYALGYHSCSAHTIEARDLHNIVLSYINKYAEQVLTDDKYIEKIRENADFSYIERKKEYECKLRKAKKRLTELDKLFASLYEDRVNGMITERNFIIMNKTYSSEQEILENEINEIQKELDFRNDEETNIAQFSSIIKKYRNISELNVKIVHELIDKIVVSDKYTDEDGNTRQKVTIFFKFVGAIDNMVFEPTKIIPQKIQKVCENCGKTYVANSNVSKWCDECRPGIKKEKKKYYDSLRSERRREYKKIHGTFGYKPKTCACCGEVYTPKSSNSKYCQKCKEERKFKNEK